MCHPVVSILLPHQYFAMNVLHLEVPYDWTMSNDRSYLYGLGIPSLKQQKSRSAHSGLIGSA